MSNQLKILLYIVFIVAIFYVVQSKLNIFNISTSDGNNFESSQVQGTTEVKVLDPYVEIYSEGGRHVVVNVEVADSEDERALGLSNRSYLGDYDGMLFIFDRKVQSSFWMKNMNFPLDILFIDESGFIVDIKENQQPCTSSVCSSITSSSSYLYVLEVNGGFVPKNHIVVGSNIVKYID